MTPHDLMSLALVPIMLLVIWRRVRGQFGRQPVRRTRMTVRIAAFAAIGLLASLAGFADIRLLEGLASGIVAGGALGMVGLRLTRFERTEDGGDAYVPNPWIGAVLTLLLVGRLAWRFSLLGPWSAVPAAPPSGTHAAWQSPFTMVVLGLLVGYYVSYYAGLLVHHRRFERSLGSVPTAP